MSKMNTTKKIARASKMLFLMEVAKDRFCQALDELSEEELQTFLKEKDVELTQLTVTPKQRVLDRIDRWHIKKQAQAGGP